MKLQKNTEMSFSNDDQGIIELFVGGAMKPDPGTENGFGYGTGFETGYGIPSTNNKGKQNGGKKRKADQTQNPKVITEAESKNTPTTSGSTITSNKNSKIRPEVPKPDYIHVRARRGQATDSHSLAERVRREKISERMRYLQDLVPGCNRITGKAGMLDEIINYVQSLQRQVEFLSMKLASIHPTPEFNINSYLAKEMFPPSSSGLPAVGISPQMVNPANIQFSTTLGLDIVDPGIEMGVNHHMDVALRSTISAPVSIPDTVLESPCLNQIRHSIWEDELHNLSGMAYLL